MVESFYFVIFLCWMSGELLAKEFILKWLLYVQDQSLWCFVLLVALEE